MTTPSDSTAIIYVLTNPAMPRLVKIGLTTRNTANDRMNELYGTGVPLPFACAYAARVSNASAVESAFHTAFAPNRINPNREFFEIEPEQAIALLKLFAVEDVTPQIKNATESVDKTGNEASQRLLRRRPSLNFIEMRIPIGSLLTSLDNRETATVVSANRVDFRGQKVSLSEATRLVLQIDYNVAPTSHWSFDGRSLNEIYNETYEYQN